MSETCLYCDDWRTQCHQLMEKQEQLQATITQQAQEIERATKVPDHIQQRVREETKVTIGISTWPKAVDVLLEDSMRWSKHSLTQLCSENSDIKQQLAAREERISGLETELEEYRSLAEKLGAEKAVSERDTARQDAARLREALSKLTNDCMASDFNEHWDSYIQAQAALKGA